MPKSCSTASPDFWRAMPARLCRSEPHRRHHRAGLVFRSEDRAFRRARARAGARYSGHRRAARFWPCRFPRQQTGPSASSSMRGAARPTGRILSAPGVPGDEPRAVPLEEARAMLGTVPNLIDDPQGRHRQRRPALPPARSRPTSRLCPLYVRDADAKPQHGARHRPRAREAGSNEALDGPCRPAYRTGHDGDAARFRASPCRSVSRAAGRRAISSYLLIRRHRLGLRRLRSRAAGSPVLPLFRFTGDEAELLSIAVARKWRGKGVGGALMHAAAKTCATAPFSTCFSRSRTATQPAIQALSGSRLCRDRPARGLLSQARWRRRHRPGHAGLILA